MEPQNQNSPIIPSSPQSIKIPVSFKPPLFIIILIIIGGLLGSFQVYENNLPKDPGVDDSNLETALLKQCPDEWIDNKMPTISDGGNNTTRTDYYILKGERKEISEFDADFVSKNCKLEKQTVY